MRLSRRELLATILGAPLAARLATGCDEAPAPPPPHVEGGFAEPSMKLGHRLRGTAPSPDELSRAPERRVPVVVVGGGPSGLAAAWRLRRRGLDRFEVLELEPSVGGTSRGGETGGFAHPWGAHYITTPPADNTDLVTLLGELDALEIDVGAPTARPRPAERLAVREPSERLFYRGFWYPGLYPAVGASADDHAQLARFERRMRAYAGLQDSRGRRAFTVPAALCSDDADMVALDTMSAEAWLRAEGFTSGRLRWLLDYACRDDYGLGLADTSAWALIFYHAARLDPDDEERDAEVITWPEGNAALVAHMTRAVGTARLRTGRLVVDVDVHDDAVTVATLDPAADTLERIRAERAILAVPGYVARRIVRRFRADPPRDRATPDHGAWMVANLQLSERPASQGSEPAWDNVLHDSPSLGYVSATHQRGRDHGPTVWTYYMPMTDSIAADGRRRLLEPTWEQWLDAVVADLARAHPDLRKHLLRMDVCRFGHGMAQPRPGVARSAALRRAREPVGRLHFAHSELSGLALFEEAFHHGVRAADEVLGELGVAT